MARIVYVHGVGFDGLRLRGDGEILVWPGEPGEPLPSWLESKTRRRKRIGREKVASIAAWKAERETRHQPYVPPGE